MKTQIINSIGAILLLTLISNGNIWAQKEGVEIGQIAPDIKMKTPDGKTIKLSELRGKMVLIDFWASWCGPCRHENPTVVKAYQNYKEKSFKEGNGFTVFSVSLDKNSRAWTDAMKADKLTWDYHVCDFAGWQTRPATIYNVRGIPSNFLINDKGVIVAKNLRGPYLEAKLKELVK